ncbi:MULTISPECIES: hypothetical protein [unclassified Halomonas]|uniref:hypothetical protein n=1 Tax=unclassified Halomonas TaxID=2609666 RepID=UPI001EF5DC39|nr:MULTISPECIES: hypothetical protein [unclassified Halomonas]MCG7590020.1 hypothetical protein [Halomonas sp. McD50-5]MCG7615930.1 hypothetical protein [Halomonas sp. McD50-4]
MDQVTWLLKRLSHAFVTQFVKVGGWFFYVMISLQLGGYDQVGKEALNRLGVQWEPASAEKAYQAGGTQIPARVVVKVKGLFNRQIAYGKYHLSIERYSS